MNLRINKLFFSLQFTSFHLLHYSEMYMSPIKKNKKKKKQHTLKKTALIKTQWKIITKLNFLKLYQFALFISFYIYTIWVNVKYLGLCQVSGCNVKYLGLCQVSGFTSSISVYVKFLGLCQVFGFMSSIWIYVEYLGLCQVSGFMSSIWVYVKNLGLCQVSGFMSNIWVYIKNLGLRQVSGFMSCIWVYVKYLGLPLFVNNLFLNSFSSLVDSEQWD